MLTTLPMALADSLNHAAGFTWHGYMDTDLQFSEFFHQDHTVMAWFMLKHPKAYEGPILTVNGSGTYFIGQGSYRDESNAAKLVIKIGNAKATYTMPNKLIAGKWLHLALVRMAGTWIALDKPSYYASRYSLYLNGVYRSRDGGGDLDVLPPRTTEPILPVGTVRLGTTNPAPTAADNQFYGFIDDVAIFTKALTASEIQSLYNTSIKRLTGGEPNLLVGYTFDSATPAGLPLPAKLNRPVTVMPPAYRSLVSQARENWLDVKLLPPPVHETPMSLPFERVQVWKVTQGYEGQISHNGHAAFALDLVRATVDALDRPQDAPAEASRNERVLAAAAGKVIYWTDQGDLDLSNGDDRDYYNKVHVEHTPAEKTSYLHMLTGSVSKALPYATPPFFVPEGTHLGGVGYGNGYHLHFGARSGDAVSWPVMFQRYEYWSPANNRWYFLEKGTPQEGQYIRRPSLLPQSVILQ
jgi:hypothetical protein